MALRYKRPVGYLLKILKFILPVFFWQGADFNCVEIIVKFPQKYLRILEKCFTLEYNYL